MGRPIKSARTGNTGAAVNTVLPIGTSGLGGNQMIFKAFVTSGSANDTTVIEQKGTKRFRCTTSDGTETCTLTAVVRLLLQTVLVERTLQVRSQVVTS